MHAFAICDVYCLYICVYMWIYIYVCVCICVYVYICVCYVYINIYIHTKFFIRFAVQDLPISCLFHSSLSNYNSIWWCWISRRNVYFELTQDEFLSFSRNTFVYLFVYFIRIRPACYPAIMAFSITQIYFLSASSNSKYNYYQNVMLANQSITYTVGFTLMVMK